MQKTKNAFTLIELIFVIVILGILASVAIPKFAATRTDAKLSKAASDVATLISDFGTYYTAQGKYKGATIADITNVKLVETTAIGADGNGSYLYLTDSSGASNCIQLKTTNEGTLTIKQPTTSADPSALCSSLKALDIIKTYKFGAIGVTY